MNITTSLVCIQILEKFFNSSDDVQQSLINNLTFDDESEKPDIIKITNSL